MSSGRLRRISDNPNGFSLIELVITIILIGIIAGVLSPIIFYGAESFRNQIARREIVSRSRLAMERMVRDVRNAVPNTIRVRSHLTADDTLEFGEASHLSRYTTISGASPYTLHDNTGLTINPAPYVVVYNTDPAAFYGYPASTTTFPVTGTTTSTVTFTAPFKPASPSHRYQLCSGAVAYGTGSAGELNRYSGYAPGQNYLVSAARTDLLIDQVQSIQFRYSPGTLSNAGLVSIEMVLAIGDEILEFHQEVHIRNVP